MPDATRSAVDAGSPPPVFGRLIIVRGGGEAAGLREEAVPFASLAALLDLCAARSQGDAFVRVEIGDTARAGARLLILDFGRFGLVAGDDP